MDKEYPSRLITENRIIGMTFEECEDFLEVRGYFPRIIIEDSQIMSDINFKRVNIELENNIVIKLLYIG